MTQQPQTNSLAIVSLVCGIISLPMLICCYGLPFNVIAIITGIIAVGQINKAPTTMTGKGLAIAGIVTGIVSFLLLFVMVLVFGVMTVMS